MFKNLTAPFQPSEESETDVFILTEESETGVFVLGGIRAPYHKTNSQPFPIPELVFDGRATPEEIALLEEVRQAEGETGLSHEN